MWYKNVDTSFFHFVTKYAFDRQRDGQKGLGALQCGNYNDETHCLNSQLVKKTKFLMELLTVIIQYNSVTFSICTGSTPQP